MLRKVAIQIASAGCVIAGLTTNAASAAEFRIWLDWTIRETSPHPTTHYAGLEISVVLSDGNRFRERMTRKMPGGRSREFTTNSADALGNEFSARSTKQAWRVVDERTLVRLAALRTHTWAMWLTTDGGRSCSVRVEWRLKPGEEAFEAWAPQRRIRFRFVEPQVRNATCEVIS